MFPLSAFQALIHRFITPGRVECSCGNREGSSVVGFAILAATYGALQVIMTPRFCWVVSILNRVYETMVIFTLPIIGIFIVVTVLIAVIQVMPPPYSVV